MYTWQDFVEDKYKEIGHDLQLTFGKPLELPTTGFICCVNAEYKDMFCKLISDGWNDRRVLHLLTARRNDCLVDYYYVMGSGPEAADFDYRLRFGTPPAVAVDDELYDDDSGSSLRVTTAEPTLDVKDMLIDLSMRLGALEFYVKDNT